MDMSPADLSITAQMGVCLLVSFLQPLPEFVWAHLTGFPKVKSAIYSIPYAKPTVDF